MLNLLLLQLTIEIKILWRNSSHLAAMITCAISIYLLIRFGFPAEYNPDVIPAILNAALILSLLGASHNCFSEDFEEDRITTWHNAKLNIEWILICRLIAYILNISLPLIACFCGIIWLELNDPQLVLHAAKIMLLISITTLTIGMISSGISCSFNFTGHLAHLLTLPFLFAIIIFAAQAMLNPMSDADKWLICFSMFISPVGFLFLAKIL